MINTEEGMQQNLELIQGMYRAITDLHRRVAPQNFDNYLILAEGPIEQIRRLKAEIDEYLGIQQAVAQGERDSRDVTLCEEREQGPSRPFHELLAESSQPATGGSNAASA